jgi:uncharacterized protein YegL
MIEALQKAFSLVGQRKEELKSQGIPLRNRPLVYLLTDGAPTDAKGKRSDQWRDLAPVIRQHEAGKHLLFFAIGVSGADQDVLRQLAPKSNYQIDGIAFSQVLQLVSSSIESIAAAPTRDQPAEEIYDGLLARHERIRKWLADR